MSIESSRSLEFVSPGARWWACGVTTRPPLEVGVFLLSPPPPAAVPSPVPLRSPLTFDPPFWSVCRSLPEDRERGPAPRSTAHGLGLHAAGGTTDDVVVQPLPAAQRGAPDPNGRVGVADGVETKGGCPRGRDVNPEPERAPLEEVALSRVPGAAPFAIFEVSHVAQAGPNDCSSSALCPAVVLPPCPPSAPQQFVPRAPPGVPLLLGGAPLHSRSGSPDDAPTQPRPKAPLATQGDVHPPLDPSPGLSFAPPASSSPAPLIAQPMAPLDLMSRRGSPDIFSRAEMGLFAATSSLGSVAPSPLCAAGALRGSPQGTALSIYAASPGSVSAVPLPPAELPCPAGAHGSVLFPFVSSLSAAASASSSPRSPGDDLSRTPSLASLPSFASWTASAGVVPGPGSRAGPGLAGAPVAGLAPGPGRPPPRRDTGAREAERSRGWLSGPLSERVRGGSPPRAERSQGPWASEEEPAARSAELSAACGAPEIASESSSDLEDDLGEPVLTSARYRGSLPASLSAQPGLTSHSRPPLPSASIGDVLVSASFRPNGATSRKSAPSISLSLGAIEGLGAPDASAPSSRSAPTAARACTSSTGSELSSLPSPVSRERRPSGELSLATRAARGARLRSRLYEAEAGPLSHGSEAHQRANVGRGSLGTVSARTLGAVGALSVRSSTAAAPIDLYGRPCSSAAATSASASEVPETSSSAAFPKCAGDPSTLDALLAEHGFDGEPGWRELDDAAEGGDEDAADVTEEVPCANGIDPALSPARCSHGIAPGLVESSRRMPTTKSADRSTANGDELGGEVEGSAESREATPPLAQTPGPGEARNDAGPALAHCDVFRDFPSRVGASSGIAACVGATQPPVSSAPGPRLDSLADSGEPASSHQESLPKVPEPLGAPANTSRLFRPGTHPRTPDSAPADVLEGNDSRKRQRTQAARKLEF